MKHTLEELLKMDARELDVLAAMLAGYENHPNGSFRKWRKKGEKSYACLKLFSTDASAAMELADEMAGLFSVSIDMDETFLAANDFSVLTKGKPSQSFPHGLTIHYILWKESLS